MTPPKTPGPTYEARDVRKGGTRRGSYTPPHEGYVPVCGRCLTRLAPRTTDTEAEGALHQHWADFHLRRAA